MEYLAGRLSGTGTVMSKFKDDKLQTFHLTSAESNSAFMLNIDHHFYQFFTLFNLPTPLSFFFTLNV